MTNNQSETKAKINSQIKLFVITKKTILRSNSLKWSSLLLSNVDITLSLHTIILHLLINLSKKFTYLVHKLRTSAKPISSHDFAGPLKWTIAAISTLSVSIFSTSKFFYSYPIFNVIWTYFLPQYVFLIQWKFLAVNVLIEGLSLNIPIDVVSL